MIGRHSGSVGSRRAAAFTFIKQVGKKHIDWALAVTGWFLRFVFADSAIVIFAPLVKALSSVTAFRNRLALALACGLQLTHCCSSDTRPLTAAGMLGVDVDR
jgi:GntP family gluconate:H+ symporter